MKPYAIDGQSGKSHAVQPRPKYEFNEFGLGREVCPSEYGRFAAWDSIHTFGDTLGELLANISGAICDQDGGELYCGPCEEQWAIDLVTELYNEASK